MGNRNLGKINYGSLIIILPCVGLRVVFCPTIRLAPVDCIAATLEAATDYIQPYKMSYLYCPSWQGWSIHLNSFFIKMKVLSKFSLNMFCSFILCTYFVKEKEPTSIIPAWWTLSCVLQLFALQKRCIPRRFTLYVSRNRSSVGDNLWVLPEEVPPQAPFCVWDRVGIYFVFMSEVCWIFNFV